MIKTKPNSKAQVSASNFIYFDPLRTKKSSAQLTQNYTEEEFQEKLSVALVNFFPKQNAEIKSETLILGAIDESQKIISSKERQMV